MKCPPEVCEILTRILQTGLLRIRALGWSGLAEQSALEADHIHNLPSLLADFSPERLAYYWDVERVSYLQQIPEDEREAWAPLWTSLQPYAAGGRLVAQASSD